MNPDTLNRKELKAPKEPHVCIVGAGVSGLRCADTLLQHGFKVTILEARDRIGGRIHQGKMTPGYLVDLGPNWIHGGHGINPILDIARETNPPTHSFEQKGFVFDEHGQSLEDGLALSETLWHMISLAFLYSKEHTSTIDPNESLFDFLAKKIEETNCDEQERRTLLQFATMWGAYVGMPVTKQSLKFFWLELCIESSEDENVFCAGTYQNILARIAQPALEGADINLSSAVRPKDGITTREAMDHFEKVYITFPKAFWMDAKADRNHQAFTGFSQFLAPLYEPEHNPKRWNIDGIELFLKIPYISFNMLIISLIGRSGAAFLQDIKAANRSISLWTVNKEYWMKWSIHKEADGVITDDPKKYPDVCERYVTMVLLVIYPLGYGQKLL